MTVVARLGPRDFRPQPWKNGGGTTTELAVYPASGRPLWRVSIADVATSGPFSDFSGYERTIMLLEGDGMVLRFEGAPEARIERRWRPFVFDGAWRTGCELLGGPVRGLNLIVDREAARGTLEVLLPREALERPLRADWTLLYALSGRLKARVGAAEHALGVGEALRIDGCGDERLSLSSDGIDPAAAMVEIRTLRR